MGGGRAMKALQTVLRYTDCAPEVGDPDAVVYSTVCDRCCQAQYIIRNTVCSSVGRETYISAQLCALRFERAIRE